MHKPAITFCVSVLERGCSNGSLHEGIFHLKNKHRNVNIYQYFIFYFVRTVHFGMKLYNDQRNAKVFSLLIYLLLPYMFRAFF
jgi:hypothetical protein